MQSLPFLVEKFIEKERLFSRKDRLLVGVSGGLDSVTLVRLLVEIGYQPELAHVNYQLRGTESKRDEQFVRRLAEELALPLHIKKIDTPILLDKNGGNLQELARELRYAWMEELAGNSTHSTASGRTYILTAHHANDQLETILMNLFRGSGLSGLKGMLPARNLIRRPLLFATRDMLEAWAQEKGYEWVEDSSNATDKYNRNRIRHELVPLIQELFPDAVRRVYGNSRNLAGVADFVREQADKSIRKLIETRGNEQWLPIRKWKTITGNRFLLFDWLSSYGFSPDQVEAAEALMESQTGQYLESGEWRLLKNRDFLILSRHLPRAENWLVLDAPEGLVQLDDGLQLEWETLDRARVAVSDDPLVACLDARQISFPVLIRKWKPGDYFYPLGMRKKKKLARFLIDQKISRSEKEGIRVLESRQRIGWVLGQRIDDRFKILPSTQTVVRFRLIKMN